MPRNFWMVVCNQDNFNITKNLEFTTQGLKSEYRRKVQRVEPGDRLLYYVTGIRCFTAPATLTSTYREEQTIVWQNEGSATWLFRIDIKPGVVLEEPQYIQAGGPPLGLYPTVAAGELVYGLSREFASAAEKRLFHYRRGDEEAVVRPRLRPAPGTSSGEAQVPAPP